MDQKSGAVKPTGTGVELRLHARVRSKKNTEYRELFTSQLIMLDVIIVTGRFDSADLRV